MKLVLINLACFDYKINIVLIGVAIIVFISALILCTTLQYCSLVPLYRCICNYKQLCHALAVCASITNSIERNLFISPSLSVDFSTFDNNLGILLPRLVESMVYLTVYFRVLFESNDYNLPSALLMRSVEFYGKLSIVQNSLKISDFDVRLVLYLSVFRQQGRWMTQVVMPNALDQGWWAVPYLMRSVDVLFPFLWCIHTSAGMGCDGMEWAAHLTISMEAFTHWVTSAAHPVPS